MTDFCTEEGAKELKRRLEQYHDGEGYEFWVEPAPLRPKRWAQMYQVRSTIRYTVPSIPSGGANGSRVIT